ncbi:uncharacterized protein LOC135693173 isoform X1 [Rhopilema esculentum]|uniref:uncharacterized protein LOC135693173 isoform X1 n=1 Tax=Rhopilema esculentum TaxID=499914 RepID=UPI0031D70207
MREKATQKLRAAFAEVDKNEDHKIDWFEIQECCDKLNISLSGTDYETFMDSDHSNDGRLDFSEFCIFVERRLENIFKAIDIDQNGKLDAYEIQKCLEMMSKPLSIRKIKAIITGMDKDGDGVINFEEFSDFFADMPTASIGSVADKWARGFGIDIGSDQVPASLPPSEVPLWRFMIAGGCGGVASRTATAPLEKIKILAQTATSSSRLKILHTLKNVWRTEGFYGLFAGNGTNLLRIFPTSAIVCLVYSRMIKYTPVDNEKNPNQPLWRLLSGATAGVVANTLTHPLDVVRARLTVQDRTTADVTRYRGISHAIQTIKSQEGVAALFRGLGPTLVSIAPFLAIQQCVYDVLKNSSVTTIFGNNVSTFLACGALAGTVAQTAVHPLDVVRRTMQVDRNATAFRLRMQSSIDVTKTLLKYGGISRLYAGLTAAYLKVVPSAALSLLVRDAILGRLKE